MKYSFATQRLLQQLLKKVVLSFLVSSSLALFVLPATANAQTGTWSATGSMLSTRGGSTATLLSNGQVLFTGGQADNSATALASAELYDPAAGTFSATGSMTTSRFDGHLATLLSNGQVLVTGGISSGYTYPVTSAEVYDPATGTFSPTLGSMITTRYSATATLLPNGQVLITGGCASSNGPNPCQTQSSAELYNPATGTFTATGSMIAGRVFHTATLLPNGQVLVAGGVDFNSYTSLASAELYDPTTGTFSATGSMITGRDEHSAALLPNGQVLVATGYNYASSSMLVSAELYNPATGTFSSTGSMTTGRIRNSATPLPNGQVLVAGGAGNSGVLASSELYDPAAGTFSATGALITGRVLIFNRATLLPNGQVLVAGGYGNSGPLASAELYTPRGPTTAELIANLADTVNSLNLQVGITNSLDAKLNAVQAALAAAQANNVTTACNEMNAFVNAVMAQSGKKLTAAEANQLIAMANLVTASLDCSQ